MTDLSYHTPLPRTRRNGWFSKIHLLLALLAWLPAAAFLFFITYPQLAKSENRPLLATYTALSTPLGPYAAAAARHWQPCCTSFATACLPYCIPLLLIAFLSLAIPPHNLPLRLTRNLLFFSFLFLWCASGIVPLIAHSLN